MIKNVMLLMMVSLMTTSCAVWPYKKDFDCPVKEGLKCKSLYEISAMADQGMFEPDYEQLTLEIKTKIQKAKTNNRECCNAG